MARSHAYLGTPIGREMEIALRRICTLQQQAVAVLTEYTPTVDQTIAMLFRDEDIAKATAARGVVREPYDTIGYTLNLGIGGPEVILGINYDRARCMPLLPTILQVNLTRSPPLLHFVKLVEAIYLQYEQVKAILHWLNRNATCGAIRYYFPVAMQLCPDTFRGMDVPSRYHPPQDICGWLQPIRDAAATMASATMLPLDAQPRGRAGQWLTFPSRTVELSHGQQYQTDPIGFYL